jgi:hypothetical protein
MPPRYRKTDCDNCGKLQQDCIWVTRVDSNAEYCLCGICRDYWKKCGIVLRNTDPDHTDVAA